MRSGVGNRESGGRANQTNRVRLDRGREEEKIGRDRVDPEWCEKVWEAPGGKLCVSLSF